MTALQDMKTELEQLVRQRDDTVGIDLKRLNYRINELIHMMDHVGDRKAINITIRADLKKRYAAFVDWLNRYHDTEKTWTQNTAMDEVLDHTWLWVEFLETEGFKL